VARTVTVAATTAAPEVLVKGLSFRNALQGLAALRGPAAVDAALARLPDELREKLTTGALISAGWYPVSEYRPLIHAVVGEMGGGPSAARALSKHNTRRDLSGIYRLLVFFLSPESIMRKAPLLYGRYRRGGRMIIAKATPGYCESVFEGCHGFDEVCWAELIGGSEAALEAAGARDVSITILSGAGDGDAGAHAVARWT
jgi:hypothetical protein